MSNIMKSFSLMMDERRAKDRSKEKKAELAMAAVLEEKSKRRLQQEQFNLQVLNSKQQHLHNLANDLNSKIESNDEFAKTYEALYGEENISVKGLEFYDETKDFNENLKANLDSIIEQIDDITVKKRVVEDNYREYTQEALDLTNTVNSLLSTSDVSELYALDKNIDNAFSPEDLEILINQQEMGERASKLVFDTMKSGLGPTNEMLRGRRDNKIADLNLKLSGVVAEENKEIKDVKDLEIQSAHLASMLDPGKKSAKRVKEDRGHLVGNELAQLLGVEGLYRFNDLINSGNKYEAYRFVKDNLEALLSSDEATRKAIWKDGFATLANNLEFASISSGDSFNEVESFAATYGSDYSKYENYVKSLNSRLSNTMLEALKFQSSQREEVSKELGLLTGAQEFKKPEIKRPKIKINVIK